MNKNISRSKIKSIEIDTFQDEYVYDLVMEDESNPYFFANNILVHNSNYFKTLASTDDEAVEIADEIGRLTNESFPGFMKDAFNCTGGNENLIKCAREIVGSSALFLHAKKKYTIKVINLDGKPVDKLKAMGSEIKKADTPKAIQNFLKGLMDIILNDGTYQQMEDFINNNRSSLIKNNTDLIYLGTAKQLNNLDEKYAEYLSHEKLGLGRTKLPGHIRAAVNYNEMVKYFESDDKLLTAGDKGIIFYVRKNQFKIEAIAFPSDISNFPDWFTENFEVDKKITEEKMIDMKLEGIFDALGQKLPTLQTAFINKLFTF